MAIKGLSVFTHQGEDYTINDPNNAAEFNASETYDAGAYVTYQGDLYRITAAHASGTTWANTSKTQVTIGNEIKTEIAARIAGDASVLAQTATEFDASKFYNVGDFVTHEGNLYRFTGAHNEGISWSGSSGVVATATVADLITEQGKLAGFAVQKSQKNLFIDGHFEPYSNINNNSGVYNVGSANVNTVAGRSLIPVNSGKTYVFSRYGSSKLSGISVSWFMYSSNGSFIGVAETEPGNTRQLTIPSGTAFIRIKLNMANSTEYLASLDGYQIEQGVLPSDYEAPYYTVIAGGAVKPDQTVFMKPTKNLFRGKYLPYSNISPTGVYTVQLANTNTVVATEYSPVKPNTQYCYTDNLSGVSASVCEYTIDKTFISRNAVSNHRFTTGENTYFVIIELNKSGQTEWLAKAKQMQIEEGDTPTEYIAPFVLDEEYYSAGSGNSSSGGNAEALSDANLKQIYIGKKLTNNLTAGVSRSVPANIYGELFEGVRALTGRHGAKNNGLIRFSFITDIHLGGGRTENYDPQYNIAAFIALSNELCDFAVNGGDMITNYYDETYMTGLPMAKDTEDQLHDMFSTLTVPYYIAKGNHDIGINGFQEIEAPESWSEGLFGIDPNTGAIYRITEENFAAYVATGLPFYRLTGYSYFTNQEIQEVCLDGYCTGATFNSEDPYGWYYYKDFNDQLRLIVLNDFYNINDEGGTGGNSRSPKEGAWLEDVLDDAIENNLAVITVSHTAGGLTNATVSEKISDFVEGGGVYVGHVHGH